MNALSNSNTTPSVDIYSSLGDSVLLDFNKIPGRTEADYRTILPISITNLKDDPLSADNVKYPETLIGIDFSATSDGLVPLRLSSVPIALVKSDLFPIKSLHGTLDFETLTTHIESTVTDRKPSDTLAGCRFPIIRTNDVNRFKHYGNDILTHVSPGPTRVLRTLIYARHACTNKVSERYSSDIRSNLKTLMLNALDTQTWVAFSEDVEYVTYFERLYARNTCDVLASIADTLNAPNIRKLSSYYDVSVGLDSLWRDLLRQRWVHTNGVQYELIGAVRDVYTNMPMAVYWNAKTFKIYSRPLTDWLRSMSPVAL